MRRSTGIALFVMLVVSATIAAAQEAQGPGGVVQLFGCTLNEGQTADNVWAAVEALADVPADQANPDPAFGVFVWTPFRGATPYDWVLGVISTDLVSMAEGGEAYAASPRAEANGLRFAALGDCVSVIASSEQLTVGSIGMTGGDRVRDAVVEVFQCNFENGAGMDDVREAIDFWKEQIAKIDSPATDEYGAFLLTPIRGGTGSDFLWVGNSPNLKSWAQSTSDYNASPEGRAADARFASISSCLSSMWNGYWIVAPQQF